LGGVDGGDLRRYDWYQFRDHDRPETNDPLKMGIAAFFYLCFDHKNHWRNNLQVAAALLSFMQFYCRSSPDRRQLERLQKLVTTFPPSRSDIESWFIEVYAPPAK
jgi:hypothetical protein